MRKLFAFLLFIFFFVNAYSQEQNEFLLNKVLTQLKLNKKDIHEPLFRSKVLPNKNSNSVLVIPKYNINETNEYGHNFFVFDAYIVVADNATGKILSKYVEKEAWTSDAMVLSEITIDTGLYQLNEKDRAFGIRVSYRGSSNPNPYYYSDLSLFIVQNNLMKRVLKNYQIDRAGGEWDTRCAGEFDESTGSIDLDKNTTNGFKNLIIKSKIKHTKSFLIGDNCEEKVTTKNSIKYLKFNGKEYK
ncbi:hypothetical protein [Epilithonimonas xixisoli]|uniref:Uncharacterized protein n=1 Tax=Epilithonimonas xixisoli TaxID=1476462 RepID=A0A4V3H2V1_9FLAO|nr:hypothetical protein [Epilithonimonas xixisoli]TDX86551.1 hypothetical protein B0I22_0685 [Epilithonimonas xixisoli]